MSTILFSPSNTVKKSQKQASKITVPTSRLISRNSLGDNADHLTVTCACIKRQYFTASTVDIIFITEKLFK